MKTDKIIYWTSTGLVAAGMLMSGVMYLSGSEQMVNGFASIGMPVYLITLLGLMKLAGAVVLVVPGIDRMKEWAYAGFAFTFTGAVWSHLATHTPWVAPLVFIGLLAVSYVYRHRVSAGVKEGKAVAGIDA